MNAYAPAVLLLALLLAVGCGGEDEQDRPAKKSAGQPAKKTGPLPTVKTLLEKGATPPICGGTFTDGGVTAAGRKAGVQGIALAECTADEEIEQLGLFELRTEDKARDAALGAVYEFAGKDAGQASGGGRIVCVTDEGKAQREICAQPLGRLVLVAISPEGNRSLGSPAQVKGLPEFTRWLEGQRRG